MINRSPLQDNDLLPLWYWHLAKGNSSLVHNPLDNSIKLPFEAPSYDPNFSPSSINSLALWVDANDSATITQTNGIISAWADKSGNERNATSGAGTPEITVEDGPNGLPFVKFRRASGDDYLNVGGDGFIARHMFSYAEARMTGGITTEEFLVIKAEEAQTICSKGITSHIITIVTHKRSIKTEANLVKATAITCLHLPTL